MAKHPVPKKKVADTASRKRYAAFVHKKHIKLQPFMELKPCPSCGNPKLPHFVCQNCGKLRDRQVIDLEKKIKKIVKVKA